MEILKKECIVVGCASEPHEDVIKRCGEILVKNGYANERYIEGMIARDRSFSTAIGNAIAIPHGEMEYKKEIKSTGLVILTYPNGVAWNGENVKLVVGIAAKGDEHMEILQKIVEIFETEEIVNDIVAKSDADALYKLFV